MENISTTYASIITIGDEDIAVPIKARIVWMDETAVQPLLGLHA